MAGLLTSYNIQLRISTIEGLLVTVVKAMSNPTSNINKIGQGRGGSDPETTSKRPRNDPETTPKRVQTYYIYLIMAAINGSSRNYNKYILATARDKHYLACYLHRYNTRICLPGRIIHCIIPQAQQSNTLEGE